MNKDDGRPPISIITTGCSSTSGNKTKNEAPLILKKKPQPQSILEEAYSTEIPNAQNEATDGKSKISDKDVDSALLAALRDNRERIALLRLEQAMIEFMNDTSCEFMEVGGPFNSVVVKGPTYSVDEEKLAATFDNGARQTSFQRLCLHRLADRFHIVREQGYASPMSHYGLIRLLKTKDSCIPKLKLIDIDLTEYDSQTSPQDIDNGTLVKGLSDRLSAVGIQDGRTKKTRKKKMEKVMIMKRSSSSSLTGGHKNEKTKKGTDKSNGRGKDLSDKEKAYAEARARIFASESSMTKDDCDHALHSEENTDSETNLNSTSHSLNSSPPEKDEPSLHGNIYSTGTVTSKVTWRNREQEASDPDFCRRHPVMMAQPFPMYTRPDGSSPYIQQQYGYYPQGYGYINEGPQAFGDVGKVQMESSDYSKREYQNSHENVKNENKTTDGRSGINLSPEEFPALS